MQLRTLHYALSLAAAALAACSGGSADADAGLPPPCEAGAPPSDASPPPSSTLYFVIRGLHIDTNASGAITDDPDAPHAGFDLDGRASGPLDPAGCNHGDFFSALDPDQNAVPGCARADCGGVDNMLPTVAGTAEGLTPGFDANAALAGSIAAARTLYVVRLEGVDDQREDPCVDLAFFPVYDADGDCRDNFDGAGAFVAMDGSVVRGDEEQPRFHARAEIVGGRLRTLTPFSSRVPVPLSGYVIEVVGSATQMRFDLPVGTREARGNWGAWVSTQALIDSETARRPAWEAAYRMIYGGLVDIEVNGICVDGVGSRAVFGGTSVGYNFSLAPARLVGVAAAPPVAPCSGVSPFDAGSDR